MIASLAGLVVALAGLYLAALGVAALLAPARAGRFLLGFADSAPKHYLELALRLAVGGAMLVHAPRSVHPGAFEVAGWGLVGTTAVLSLLPWRWHHRFARAAVPRAMRRLPLVGLASLLLGALVLAAVAAGMTAGAP